MTRKERFKLFLEHFQKNQPNPETELRYRNPFELLVAVVLSAQCTDKRVNMVTPEVFKKFPDPEHMAEAAFEELYPLIRSVSFANNKTKHLIAAAKLLRDKFNGQVPDSIEALQELPGVGRKTANVIASVIYNQPAMAVDTHVFRVSKRIGLVDKTAKTPLAVERQLVKYIPDEVIPKAHHWLILHGRYVCKAVRPLCEQCAITYLCQYFSDMQKVILKKSETQPKKPRSK